MQINSCKRLITFHLKKSVANDEIIITEEKDVRVFGIQNTKSSTTSLNIRKFAVSLIKLSCFGVDATKELQELIEKWVAPSPEYGKLIQLCLDNNESSVLNSNFNPFNIIGIFLKGIEREFGLITRIPLSVLIEDESQMRHLEAVFKVQPEFKQIITDLRLVLNPPPKMFSDSPKSKQFDQNSMTNRAKRPTKEEEEDELQRVLELSLLESTQYNKRPKTTEEDFHMSEEETMLKISTITAVIGETTFSYEKIISSIKKKILEMPMQH